MPVFMSRILYIRRLILVLAVACFGLYPAARAQRHTPGRPSFRIATDLSLGKTAGFGGGGAEWHSYSYSGNSVLGAYALRSPVVLVTPAVVVDDVEVFPEERSLAYTWEAAGRLGYMFRLWSPRSRWAVLSAGGGLDVGMRFFPGGEDEDVVMGFLLALSPEILAEVFPFRNVSLGVSFQPRMSVIDRAAFEKDEDGKSTGSRRVPWYRGFLSFSLTYYL